MTERRTTRSVAAAFDRQPAKLEYQMGRFFGQALPSVAGARVLDVGAGSGLLSFFASASGAREVISLEPEAAGSRNGVTRQYEAKRVLLGLEECHLVTTDFLEYQSENPFDLLVSHNSINHIREVQTDIREDAMARESQGEVVARMVRCLRIGGWLIVADCSRRNAFADVGLRSPIQKTIDWTTHQTPRAWRALFAEHGIGNFSITHCVPHGARWLATVVGSPVFSYFTYSWFVLRGQRLT